MKDLDSFPIQNVVAVQWGDMDAYRHVNNRVYLQWIENARVDFFEQFISEEDITTADIGPVLGWQDCKYIFPVTYPDTVYVGYKVSEIKDDRLICESRIYSKSHNRLVAISYNEIIPFSLKESTKMPIPKNWIDRIEQL